MTDFAKEQSTWYATWPSSDDERAFRMWGDFTDSKPIHANTLSFQWFCQDVECLLDPFLLFHEACKREWRAVKEDKRHGHRNNNVESNGTLSYLWTLKPLSSSSTDISGALLPIHKLKDHLLTLSLMNCISSLWCICAFTTLLLFLLRFHFSYSTTLRGYHYSSRRASDT